MPKMKSNDTIEIASSKRTGKRKLPPDPEGLNHERAAQGKSVTDPYHQLTGTDPSC